ncbi:MAG TPA: 50S ribosomal protein L31e [Nitrososphaera sp.]|nr:50S ribosomal protein L31e [Nitrososphaera sp.]
MATVEENLTRVYTINLGRAWITPQHKRTDRVINMIREFATKHMKSDEIKLEQDLNRQIWTRGKTHPPRKVRVKMVKDGDGVVTVSLYEDAPTPAEVPAAEIKPEVAPAETTAAAEEPKAEAKPEEVKTEAAK